MSTCQHVTSSKETHAQRTHTFLSFPFRLRPSSIPFLPIARNFSINSYDYSGRPPGPLSKAIRKLGKKIFRRHEQVRLHWKLDNRWKRWIVVRDQRYASAMTTRCFSFIFFHLDVTMAMPWPFDEKKYCNLAAKCGKGQQLLAQHMPTDLNLFPETKNETPWKLGDSDSRAQGRGSSRGGGERKNVEINLRSKESVRWRPSVAAGREWNHLICPLV